ncbi:MAG: Putative Peptidase M23B [candidate division TA06 bacterium 32_111]|nr:MAG: Putative Peptidase M23B [candidate division TA06 bacterium 32_111]KUK87474.1 MAG: Putative Peptidase M23B [candidate division TA06 bacterium 34_109]
MDRFFRKRKINISIVPNDSSNTKGVKILFVTLPILFILTISLITFLTISTIQNLKNINKYSSVKKTKEEIKILSQKDQEIKKSIAQVEKGITDLKKEIKELTPLFDFFSGHIGSEEEDFEFSTDLDTLLFITKYLRNLSDSIFSFLKNNNEKIPSLVPINGWVLRKYGKVKDPFTETEKFSNGILFIAELNSDVFSTISGRVTFAGIKNEKNGNMVKIDNGLFTVEYSHLSTVSVKYGDYVKKGQKVGTAGKSGKTLSSSVFYKIIRGNKTLDPELSFLIPTFFLYDTLNTNL